MKKKEKDYSSLLPIPPMEAKKKSTKDIIKKHSTVKKGFQAHDLVEPETALDEFFLDDKTILSEKNKIRKKLGMTYVKEHTKKRSVYELLKVRFYKAGMQVEPQDILKKFLYITFIVLGIGFLTILIWTLVEHYPLSSILIFELFWLIFGSLLLYPLMTVVLKSYLNYRIFRRRMQVELVLPEFLRLVASNYRSGMPLDKALIKSNRPRFGIFSKEVELMAKTTQVKGDLGKALEIFGKKFDSKMLERSMNSISMTVRSGSNVSNLLEEIATNITKMRNMRLSMVANVKNYIIFIIIAAVIIAPLMFSMSYTMNTTIGDIKGLLGDQMEPGGSVGKFGAISTDGGMKIEDFNVFASLMLITNSIISAFVISLIQNGNYQQGIKNIPVFLAITFLLYYLGKIGLSSFISIS